MKFAVVILLFISCIIGVVSAENVYIPTEQLATPYGTLYVHVLCMNNLISRDMTLTNLDAGQSITLELQPDGTFDTDLVAGNYLLVLEDGNAGHSESRQFTIVGGETSYEWFVGHAQSDHAGTLVSHIIHHSTNDFNWIPYYPSDHTICLYRNEQGYCKEWNEIIVDFFGSGNLD